jgi:hypothetical protein
MLFRATFDDNALFRSLLLIFVPTLVGGALASRAYALPIRPDAIRAAQLVDGLPERIKLPPLVRITVPVPEETSAIPERKGSVGAPNSPSPVRQSTASQPTRSRLLEILSNDGNGVHTLLSPTSDEVLEAALIRAGRQESASLDATRLQHVSVSRGSTDVSVDIDATGQSALSVASGELRVRGKESGGAEPTGSQAQSSNPEAVRTVMNALRGSVESCAQQAGKLGESVSGRLSLAWTVQSGESTAVRVLENGTRNSALSDCVVRVVQRADFPTELTAEIDGYTWILRGS